MNCSVTGFCRTDGRPICHLEKICQVPLPILRARLQLQEGQTGPALAAWLDPSDWQLKTLQQVYFRRSAEVYQYSSPAHGFSSELRVNDYGLVTDYPGIWLAE